MTKQTSPDSCGFLKEKWWSKASSSETSFWANFQSLTNSSDEAGSGEKNQNMRILGCAGTQVNEAEASEKQRYGTGLRAELAATLLLDRHSPAV